MRSIPAGSTPSRICSPRAVTQRFASEGASVALVDLDESAAAEAAARISVVDGAVALGVGADVSDAAAVSAAVGRVVEEAGGVHVLVNNAGITRDNLLFKMTEEDWDLVMGVHLKGAFLMTKAVQGHFVAQQYGKVVNLSSISALGNRGQANYSAAKMGIQGLTRTLAIELGPFGVNVNAVAPGFVATEMTDATAARMRMGVEEFRRLNADAVPVKRVGSPTTSHGHAFLASDEASYVTGQTLYVDGGASVA